MSENKRPRIDRAAIPQNFPEEAENNDDNDIQSPNDVMQDPNRPWPTATETRRGRGRLPDARYKIISTWNFKGGVGKTTLTFSLGYALAMQGKRVMLVDADPQKNLTQLALNFWLKNPEQAPPPINLRQTLAEDFNEQLPTEQNLYTALRPVLTQRTPIAPARLLDLPMLDAGTLDEQFNCPDNAEPNDIEGSIFILPGSFRLAEFDEAITVAFNSNSAASYEQYRLNFPAAFHHLMDLTARQNEIDIILVDMSPAIGALNRTILFSSHLFIMPFAPDFFSDQAANTLANLLPTWFAQYDEFRRRARSVDIQYKLPEHNVKFGGMVLMRYAYTRDFEVQNDVVLSQISELHQTFRKFYNNLPQQLRLPLEMMPENFELDRVPEYHQLGQIGQRQSVPVAYLPNSYLKIRKRDGTFGTINRIAENKRARRHQRQVIERIVTQLLSFIENEDHE